MESLDLCACNSTSLDHPLRQRASLLGHTALNSRDFELQWDPHGSRKPGRKRSLEATHDAQAGWAAGGGKRQNTAPWL